MTAPCLSEHDHCTIYPVRAGRPNERRCCLARERYDAGTYSMEKLLGACETVKVRGEGFVEVGGA